jgi:hypothetical protein
MILLVIAVILLALVLLLAGFLVIPLTISFRATVSAGSTEGELSVRWLGLRLLRRKITGGRKRGQGRPQRFDPVRMIRAFLDSIPTLVMLLRAFGRAVSIRSLTARVTFGLGDPAETAVMAGYAWALSSVVNLLPGTSLSVTPDVERERFEGAMAGEVGVRLLPLAVAFVRAYTRKPFRTLMGEVRRGGRE